MPATVFSEAEDAAMYGLPHVAQVTYFRIRQRMDYATGLVGARAGAAVSWRAIAEMLHVDPHSGPVERFPTTNAGIQRARRAVDWLVRAGLVKMRGNSNDRQLIFLLPYALTTSRAQKHPDSNPTDHPDRPSTQGQSTGTRQRVNGVTRQASEVGVRSSIQAAAVHPAPKNGVAYPQACSKIQREALQVIAAQARLTQEEEQLLLDELADRMRRTPRVDNPPSMFRKFVQQLREGTFEGLGARATRAGGKALSEEEARMANEGGRAP